MLSAARHLLYHRENKPSRSLGEFALDPFVPLRAVLEWKANGLGMASRKVFSAAFWIPPCQLA